MEITTLKVYPEILTVTGDIVDVCGQAYETAANIPAKLNIAFTMTQNQLLHCKSKFLNVNSVSYCDLDVGFSMMEQVKLMPNMVKYFVYI